MNDTHRVEAGLIPALIYAVVKNMEVHQKSEQEIADHKFITDTSYQAYFHEPVAGMMPKRQTQIRRRLDRLYLKLAPLLNQHTNGMCMMIIYYMLEGLIQDGFLSIYGDTEFAKAMEAYLEPIQYLFRQEQSDQEAKEHAASLMRVVREEGYFI